MIENKQELQKQFDSLGLSKELEQAVEELGFIEATDIQAESIPLIMQGRDIIGHSQTGTGKTAAFGIPAIEMLEMMKKDVQVLILCPTRELAMQGSDELRKFGKHKRGLNIAAVYGGQPIERQIMQLRKGSQIVIGTPGRIMDHMRRNTLKLRNIKMVILDEADEMLNMGFREDIETILTDIPNEHQTVLFSATMPPAILSITKQYQKDPVIVRAGQKSMTVDATDQHFYEAPMGRKKDALALLIDYYDPKLSMVFCNTKKMVDELVEDLTGRGFGAMGLHGDMKQASRTQVMNSFKGGRVSILVATDVAARGIDVDDIEAVFNYDIPQDPEYYIHRIGRTGRAGKKGLAITIISGRKQVYEMRDIQRLTKADIKQKALPSYNTILQSKTTRQLSTVKEAIEANNFAEYAPMVNTMVEEGNSLETIATALMGMVFGKIGKDIPVIEIPAVSAHAVYGNNSNAPMDNSGRMRPNTNRPLQNSRMVKLSIDIGRDDKIAPNFIVGAVVEASGLKGSDIGKIEIYDKHTHVDVPREKLEHILTSMTGVKIRGQKTVTTVAEDVGESRPNNFYQNKNRGRPDNNRNFQNKSRSRY